MLTAVATLLADGADVESDPGSADGASVVQLVLGILFVGLAIRQWRNRPRPDAPAATPKLFSIVDSLTAPRAALLGVGAAVDNPKNLPLGISAGLGIAQAGVTGGGAVGAVAIFAIIASITIIIPGHRRARHRGTQPAAPRRHQALALANNATIMAVLFIVLGAKTLGSGLAIGD